MFSLGALTFLEPWALTALVVLPAIWWLLKTQPPRTKVQPFPPIALLRNLRPGTPPPDRIPLWLLLLRLLLAALLILALARPVLNAADDLPGQGPVMVIVDNGWQSAPGWRQRVEALRGIAQRAERQDRPLILLPSAGGGRAEPPAITARSAREVLERLAALEPMPWAPDHAALLAALKEDATEGENGDYAVWLSDGLKHAGTVALRDYLRERGTLEIHTAPAARFPLALLEPRFDGLKIALGAVRPKRDFESRLTVEARARDGRRLAGAELVFSAGATRAEARLDLPQRMRNDIARLSVADLPGTGATYLFDSRDGRPLVGIAETSTTATPPLRTAEFFLSRALEPYSATLSGTLEELLEQKVTLLFLADMGAMPGDTAARLEAWVAEGGVLVRFAGPRMAQDSGRLVPVELRSGGRSFGGAFSWDEPKRLQPFSEDSPFYGLAVPDDVTVSRQLLASPHPELARRTWARLEDGTPLVTAVRRGEGWIVLFHTTANADWSDLALSGLFVDFLRQTLTLARAGGGAGADLTEGGAPALLAPLSLLDGRGELVPPPPGTAPIRREVIDKTASGPSQPPGYYGPEGAALALNLAGPAGPIGNDFAFAEFDAADWGAITRFGENSETRLWPGLLAAAFGLALADLAATLLLTGISLPLALPAGLAGPLSGAGRRIAPSFRRLIRPGGTALLLVLLDAALATPAPAQQLDDDFAVDATRETRIAWIPTDNPSQDRLIEAGLKGLGRVLRIRSSVDLGEPVMVDPERDALALFALIYWPVDAGAQASLVARRRIGRYLASGGMILIDSGIGDPAGNSLGLARPEATAALQRVLEGLSLPALVPVDRDHVLSRSFYLLERFPGRISGRPVWVEKGTDSKGEGVSGLIIGGADWPSAWALDEAGAPLVPDLPGGAQQRELAYRFGVNVVMYALTGTYKDDQLHLPLIMSRLGD